MFNLELMKKATDNAAGILPVEGSGLPVEFCAIVRNYLAIAYLDGYRAGCDEMAKGVMSDLETATNLETATKRTLETAIKRAEDGKA